MQVSMGAKLVYRKTEQVYSQGRTLEERATEVYHLGQLTKKVPDWVKRDSLDPNATRIAKGPVYVTYNKQVLWGRTLEYVNFKNEPHNKEEHLFFRNLMCGGSIFKTTDRKGRVRRGISELTRNKRYSAHMWEPDIVVRLQSLPPHVRDVYGV